MKILIADSGSTKTEWMGHDTVRSTSLHFITSGLNPCLMDDEAIADALNKEVAPQLTEATPFDAIYFYGAGCRPDQCGRMAGLLLAAIPAEKAEVASDLLGAARALCGDDEGIVAILGTGSGSAVYDGKGFTQQTPSLGFILGDEGSGAVLGRRLLGDVFKRQLDADVLEVFDSECGVKAGEAIRRVYRESAPNRYLAQFTRFLAAHRDNASVHHLLVNEFQRFFNRNCEAYHRKDLAVNFVGSLAQVFKDELKEAADSLGFKVGCVLRTPTESLVDYHIKSMQ